MKQAEVNLEQAKLLKQAGFDVPCKYFFPEGDKGDTRTCYESLKQNHNSRKGRYSCPTVALAIQWLREVKKIIISIMIDDYHHNSFYYFMRTPQRVIPQDIIGYKSYSLVETEALDMALKILTTTP